MLAGAAGSLLGSIVWHWAARAVSASKLKAWSRRHGRWLAFSPDEVDRSCRWFRRHGLVADVLGPASIVAPVLLALWCLWRVLRSAPDRA